MRYVVGHFLHVFTYILLTRVQLFINKPRPFAQVEIDAGAHAQIFTTEGIPSGTEALKRCPLAMHCATALSTAVLGRAETLHYRDCQLAASLNGVAARAGYNQTGKRNFRSVPCSDRL